jgi:uncharacterized protein (TIGR03492 family)
MPSNKDTVLFTSNCFGEDRSAALIAVELQKVLKGARKGLAVTGASLISKGEEYSKREIKLLFSSYIPPSGGFPTRSLKGFLSDLFTGSLGSTFRFIRTIKKNKDRIRVAVVVGDVSLLLLTRMALKKTPIVFLAPAKSDYMDPHYPIEEWFIKKNTDVILAHDQFTAGNLRKKGLNARFLGNPMVDGLEPAGKTLRSKDKKTVTIGLLPGSREEAYDNFLMILELALKVGQRTKARFIAALPGSLNASAIRDKVAPRGWKSSKRHGSIFLAKQDTEVRLTWGMFTDVLHASDFLIGLAGTAVEQAAALGKPVISFVGSGPQTTKQRMTEQEELLGGAMKFARRYPEDALADALLLCEDPAERKKRGARGMKRMGKPGGAKKIARYVFDRYLRRVEK